MFTSRNINISLPNFESMKQFESSANNLKFKNFVAFGKSFMYIRKRVGPEQIPEERHMISSDMETLLLCI